MKKKTISGNYVKFLGTAGARFVVARQIRFSAGTLIRLNGKNIILDPGPGTLLRLARSRPPIDVAGIDAVILTHAHIDHTGDVNALIDAMTAGGFRKHGLLFAPQECLEGDNRVVLPYLRGFLDGIHVLKPETRYRVGRLSFMTSARHQHSAETYGVIFAAGKKKIAFMADTRYFPGLMRSYRGTDMLIMNVVRHLSHEYADVLHLSVDDVRTIIRELEPGTAILTHLGMTMVRLNPRGLSERLSAELGRNVIVATDGLTVPIRDR
jgi:ribonuclease BN (tRNA processing enzyme)